MEIAALLSIVATALGTSGLTEENAGEKIPAAVAEFRKKATDAEAALSRVQAELAAAKQPPTLSADRLEILAEKAEGYADRLDGLVGGTVEFSRELADALKGTLLGTSAAPAVAMLSRAGTAPAPAKSIIEALVKAHKPAGQAGAGRGGQQLGGGGGGGPKTPAQPTHLSRGGDAGGDGDPAKAAADEAKRGVDAYMGLLETPGRT